MTINPDNRVLAVSQKVYGWLLRAYPPRHRAEYGPAMAQLFRDQGRDAWAESRGRGLVKLWLRVLPDLVKTSIIERLAALTARKSMTDKIASLVQPRTVFLRTFVVVFLITVLMSVAITYILPESYASTTRMKVENDPPTTGYDPYFIQTQFEIMQSELVLDRVIDKLNLNVEWGKRYFAGKTLKSVETREILRGRLGLAPVRNSQLVAITAYSDDSHEAASIANAIGQAYQDYREDARSAAEAKGLDVLQQEYKEEEEQIRQFQTELAARTQESGVSAQFVAGKQQELAQLSESHKQLYAKIHAGQMAAKFPKRGLVQITDTAEPGRAPVRPNKTLNIVVGVVVGTILAAVAGGLSAFIALHFVKRKNLKVTAG
ncbi:MAG: GNVR domain-containing protein [Verrucomicrobiae bacterium]|nr:GNVR domain-containing protein [Verrucomicrobiae bacterium]